LFSPKAVSDWAAKRFPETFPYAPNAWADEKPLDTRERNSLLIIIAALADIAGAEKINIAQPSKAAETIEAAARRLKKLLDTRTIATHLKRAHDLLDLR
jgi:hypothetical protein